MNTNYLEYYTTIFEKRGFNKSVIVIDIQPAYITYCKHIMPKFISFLNEHRGKIIYFYNGAEVGTNDDDDSMVEFLLDWGLDDEKLEQIEFREKEYAFFRNWMDMGMERRHLIKAIRYMYINKYNDSRDVDLEEWENLFGEDWSDVKRYITHDSIFFRAFNIAEFKQNSPFYLCGGSKDQCLSEMRFLFEAFNIPYKIIKSLVY